MGFLSLFLPQIGMIDRGYRAALDFFKLFWLEFVA
jgi:hypothetical protein